MQEAEYKNFRIKLLNHFDKSLVSISTHYNQAIFIKLKNDFIAIVIPYKCERKDLVMEKNIHIIFDENFQFLKKCIEETVSESDFDFYENFGLRDLFYLVKGFKKNINQEEAIYAYKKTIDYLPRKLLSETHNIGWNPGHEFFLFGNDELSPRYRGYPHKKILGDKNKVLILDKSAVVIGDINNRSIDLLPSTFYRDEKFIYLDKNIVSIVRTESNENDSLIVGHSINPKTLKKSYAKLVLDPSVDLSKVKKTPYENVDKKIFNLICKNDVYHLEDDDGEKIKISHPDLLIYIL